MSLLALSGIEVHAAIVIDQDGFLMGLVNIVLVGTDSVSGGRRLGIRVSLLAMAKKQADAGKLFPATLLLENALISTIEPVIDR
ncbi:hypothetical protein TgHK011_003744 [Trichoderma gracile]|nr:hypothetical protein TgHK011_003744 [Trichoderma gracile]